MFTWILIISRDTEHPEIYVMSLLEIMLYFPWRSDAECKKYLSFKDRLNLLSLNVDLSFKVRRRVHLKLHPIPYIVHYFLPGPTGFWSKVLDYEGIGSHLGRSPRSLSACLSSAVFAMFVIVPTFHRGLESKSFKKKIDNHWIKCY